MDGCPNEKCELKQEIQAIRESSEKFQRDTTTILESFKDEMRNALKDVDRRHTRNEERLETELRSEVQRGHMAMDSKINTIANYTSDHLISISSDLGEIKGALGLKANKDETGKIRSSVMNRLELQAKKTEEMEERSQRFNQKILFTIIGGLGSGLLLLGAYILKELISH